MMHEKTPTIVKKWIDNQPLEWRRRELNPRPKTTLIAASTCLSVLLISTPATKNSTLHRSPDVFFSPLSQRPSQEASLLFSADRSQTSRSCRGHLIIRRPLRKRGR